MLKKKWEIIQTKLNTTPPVDEKKIHHQQYARMRGGRGLLRLHRQITQHNASRVLTPPATYNSSRLPPPALKKASHVHTNRR